MKALAAALAVLACILAKPAKGADWQVAVKLNTGFAAMSGIIHRGTLGTGERIGIDIDGVLAICELKRVELLREVLVWACECPSARYRLRPAEYEAWRRGWR